MRALIGLLLLLAVTGAQAGVAALVIDDLGYSKQLARRALALPPPVVAAVLPDTPYSTRIARAAERAGTEVILHLPMEPVSAGFGSTPDMLRMHMNAHAFRARVQRALRSVPGAVGVNNHMGSRLTGAGRPMHLLMDELARMPADLLFLDSRTTAESRAAQAALAAGLRTAQRDVFLDNDLDPVAIETQVRRWLAQARKDGCALAIGHPHPATLRVLERVLPRADDVERVGIQEYVDRCGTRGNGGSLWRVSSYPSPTAPRSSRPSPSSTSSGAPASRSSSPDSATDP